MASSGPNYPGTVVSTGAGTDWTSPTNVGADDGSYATLDVPLSGGDSLDATGLGFSIPAGTIDGITVEVERKITNAQQGIKDVTAQLIVGGSATGDNKADTVNAWTTSDVTKTYGGTSDLWGLTPSVAEVNGSDFGFRFAAKNAGAKDGSDVANVDFIRITINYTAGGGATTRRYSLTTLGVG